jgi:hypothetical protein
MTARDRAAVRYGKLRRVAESLDRREDNRLDEPLPTPQQRLGVVNRDALAFLRRPPFD